MENHPTQFNEQYLENWNVDTTVNPPVMVRGMMVKADSGPLSGTWQYWNGAVTLSGNVQIGTVELKDQGSDNRATVANSALWVTEQGTWGANSSLQQSTIAQLTSINYLLSTPSAVVNGRTIFEVANSSIVIASSVPVREVTIKALWDNVSSVYIGSSTMTTATGYQLGPGDAISMPIDNVNLLYGNAEAVNDGVTWIGVA